MARGKKSAGPGAVASATHDAEQGKERVGIDNASREIGSARDSAEAKPYAKSWTQALESLKTLECEGNPVCVVYWPTPNAELWGGTYGSAKILAGDPLAITADGKRHQI